MIKTTNKNNTPTPIKERKKYKQLRPFKKLLFDSNWIKLIGKAAENTKMQGLKFILVGAEVIRHLEACLSL